jgi:hypothetical protein
VRLKRVIQKTDKEARLQKAREAITMKYDSGDVTDDWIENTLELQKQTEEEIQEIKRQEDEYRQQKTRERTEEKRNRQKRKAENFPHRVVLVEYPDADELVITPYPFSGIFRMLAGSFLTVVPITIGVLAMPFMAMIAAFGSSIKEFIRHYIESVTLQIILFMGVVIPVVVFIGSIPIVIIHIIILMNANRALRIRVTKKQHILIYTDNPRKPLFLGEKKEVHLYTKIPGCTLPGGRGSKNEFWLELRGESKIDKNMIIFSRNGISFVDLPLIQKFIQMHFQ